MSVKNYKIYEVIGKCVELLDSIDLGNGGKEVRISECGPTIELKTNFNSVPNNVKQINMIFYEHYIQLSVNVNIDFSFTNSNVDLVSKSTNITSVIGLEYKELNSVNSIQSAIKEYLQHSGISFIENSKQYIEISDNKENPEDNPLKYSKDEVLKTRVMTV